MFFVNDSPFSGKIATQWIRKYKKYFHFKIVFQKVL